MAQNMKVVRGLAAGVTYDATYKTHNIDDIQYKLKIVALTGDTTLNPATHPSGTLFTNRGMTAAVVLTLPTPAAALAGYEYYVFSVADYYISVECVGGKMVAFNDAAADAISYDQAGEIIGGGIRVVCDGTSWLVWEMANEAVTPTITT